MKFVIIKGGALGMDPICLKEDSSSDGEDGESYVDMGGGVAMESPACPASELFLKQPQSSSGSKVMPI